MTNAMQLMQTYALGTAAYLIAAMENVRERRRILTAQAIAKNRAEMGNATLNLVKMKAVGMIARESVAMESALRWNF
jgi:hypothetical protein